MRFAAIALAAAIIGGPMLAPAMAQAPAGTYAIDKTHASLTWKILHQGLSYYSARFTHFDAELVFDEKDVTKSKLTVTIPVSAVETDYAKQRPAGNTTDFNKEVVEDARFMDGLKHPDIKFVSTSITKTGDKTGKAVGDLTFRGVTKPVTLDITYVGNRADPRSGKHKLGFAATGKIKRSEFGMTFGQAFLGDDVSLDIAAEFIQK